MSQHLTLVFVDGALRYQSKQKMSTDGQMKYQLIGSALYLQSGEQVLLKFDLDVLKTSFTDPFQKKEIVTLLTNFCQHFTVDRADQSIYYLHLGYKESKFISSIKCNNNMLFEIDYSIISRTRDTFLAYLRPWILVVCQDAKGR